MSGTDAEKLSPKTPTSAELLAGVCLVLGAALEGVGLCHRMRGAVAGTQDMILGPET